jgi:hypothetical protein
MVSLTKCKKGDHKAVVNQENKATDSDNVSQLTGKARGGAACPGSNPCIEPHICAFSGETCAL